ncbi:AraC family transcriptional regulator [Rhodococcus qingshengii]|uniref:helix-turn-helix transcriptional regulator n=1 Tax=Rhodococcus qingshengii TaxID=334542 RepID=UPI0010A5C4F1|nr:AraC family transcriptional regulator [Rhodococcus qingshengii]THJ66636.1 AraC family transcriptional regulator [Rhodococcus qingshengii]
MTQSIEIASDRAFYVTRDIAAGVLHFPAHRHDTDELMWARRGRLELVVSGNRLSLHRGHLAWIPSREVHEATLLGDGELLCLFGSTALRPRGERWGHERVVAVSELTAALLTHLEDSDRPATERGRSVDLLYELIDNSEERKDTLAIPSDARASTVANALIADPSDSRTLEDWARSVGASPRTVARTFQTETGMSFGRWRTTVRVHAAMDLLGRGTPVHEVAAAVGYSSTSAFIEMFRTTVGSTPAVYTRSIFGDSHT